MNIKLFPLNTTDNTNTLMISNYDVKPFLYSGDYDKYPVISSNELRHVDSNWDKGRIVRAFKNSVALTIYNILSNPDFENKTSDQIANSTYIKSLPLLNTNLSDVIKYYPFGYIKIIEDMKNFSRPKIKQIDGKFELIKLITSPGNEIDCYKSEVTADIYNDLVFYKGELTSNECLVVELNKISDGYYEIFEPNTSIDLKKKYYYIYQGNDPTNLTILKISGSSTFTYQKETITTPVDGKISIRPIHRNRYSNMLISQTVNSVTTEIPGYISNNMTKIDIGVSNESVDITYFNDLLIMMHSNEYAIKVDKFFKEIYNKNLSPSSVMMFFGKRLCLNKSLIDVNFDERFANRNYLVIKEKFSTNTKKAIYYSHHIDTLNILRSNCDADMITKLDDHIIDFKTDFYFIPGRDILFLNGRIIPANKIIEIGTNIFAIDPTIFDERIDDITVIYHKDDKVYRDLIKYFKDNTEGYYTEFRPIDPINYQTATNNTPPVETYIHEDYMKYLYDILASEYFENSDFIDAIIDLDTEDKKSAYLSRLVELFPELTVENLFGIAGDKRIYLNANNTGDASIVLNRT